MILLISNIVVKAEGTEYPDSIIGRAQAIVAYEMNLVSLKQYDDSLYTQFIQTIGENITIESMEDFFSRSGLTSNLSLTKKIKDLKPNPGKDIVFFYSNDIFKTENSEIVQFLEKRENNSINAMKTSIERGLKELCEEYENKSNSVDDNKGNNAEKKEEKNSVCIWAVLIPYVLLLGAVAIIVFLFKWNKKLEKKVAGLVKEKEKYNGELSNSEYELQKLRKKVKELETQCEELRKSRDEFEKLYQDSQAKKEPAKEIQKENVQEIEQPKEYFVQSPKDGVFDEGTNIYRPGKAIYKIVSLDDTMGELEFINSKEAVEYARQSKSQYVEPACNILNDGDMTIEGIVTERKGKVKRVDNGWSIVEKANVRLM